jgi:V/A-type H+-transporting ATPase subunit C
MLTGDDYSALLLIDSVDGLLGALGQTVYGPDVQRAMLRFAELRCLDEAIRTHLGHRLQLLSTIYEGEERRRLDLLLHRWDLRNLRTILRGRLRLEGSEQLVALLIPAGTIDEAALIELASQPSLRATIELMMTWQLPSPGTAGHLLDVLPEYEASGDPSVLERALQSAYARHLHSSLRAEPEDDLTRVLRMEIDLTNILTALRLRRSRLDEEPDWDLQDSLSHYLPGGRIDRDTLEAARMADDSATAASELSRELSPAGWREALTLWAGDENLMWLTTSMTATTTTKAVNLFSSGDPLGIAIPVAFAWAKENEARNLRLIARGVVHHVSPDVTEKELIVA